MKNNKKNHSEGVREIVTELVDHKYSVKPVRSELYIYFLLVFFFFENISQNIFSLKFKILIL